MATANVNGSELYYEVCGNGPPLLAIHGGLGFDHVYMKATLGRLERDFEVTYYDQRGNGRSDRVQPATLTMEQLADDAAALIAHLGHQNAIVLGHSYGGFVAQELAIRHPARVRALVLVDTTPGQLGAGESADETEQGPPIPPEMAAMMSSAPSSDEEFALSMGPLLPYYFHNPFPPEAASMMDGTSYSVAAMVRGFEVLSRWSSVDRLGTIGAPTLLLWGRHDLICSAPQATRIAKRIPGAEVRFFEQSGHFPWIEEPEAFFRALREWANRKRLV
jgi:proline iminopeptidase